MSDQNFEETDSLVLDEKTKDLELSQLIAFIEGRFKRSKDWRRFDEERWLQSYRNYRGLYGLMYSLQKQNALVYLLR